MKRLAAMAAQVLWFLLTPAVAFSSLIPLPPLVAAASGSNIAPPPPVVAAAPRPGCPSMCGTVNIPYPFGIGVECAWGSDNFDFAVTCNHSFNPPRLYTLNPPRPDTDDLEPFEVISISLEAGEIRVFSPVSYICYNSSNTTDSTGFKVWSIKTGPFLLSKTRNVFTGIGCSTLALLAGREDLSYYTGCYTSCMSLHAAAQDGEECAGLGCCQMPIPTNLSTIHINLGNDDSYTPTNTAWRYSPCSYAFIAEKGSYNFTRRDLARLANKTFTDRVGNRTIRMVLDWAIRDGGSCQAPTKDAGASAKQTAPACISRNSLCVNATHGSGYLCQCSEGYAGNPYVTDGCTNINECELTKYHCGSNSKCHDTQGDYVCKCKFGYKGDGKSEKGCRRIFPGYATAILVALVSLTILVILPYLLYKEHERRIRRGYFDKNGGKILSGANIVIFSEAKLSQFTNNFSEEIGRGAFGMVFKGINDEHQPVAVKRPIVEGEKPQQGGEFVGEIIFQFDIRHPNIVPLVGCCLETSIPMLVFEFIPNGSLSDMLHGAGKPRSLSLQKRLDIAIGSAEALTYMHSEAGHNNRIHGDVKSGNILLDDDLNPKVSDFGSSKLVSIASRYAKWSVAGDMSYIDPVYINTGSFTEKSDVYSFGVVLLELITRKKAKYDGSNSLPMNFVKTCKKEGNGRKMYDRDIFSGEDAQSQRSIECLDRVGALAVRCLKEDVEERPTMAEVVEELKQVKLIAFGNSGSEAS
ncbi:hypothetical protein SEVIR_8G188600v4 [Setaria viridis]|uniref:Protein kinase domain-containing protein n=1 Tax=Setaria viridis TaxID=4556 RepID=A0A4U6TK35_SETVI|nr:wall-associated receptor kinase 2-like [Setaria viridis]TKW01554.1 hypothetical protein SEVIR_8G188600v2 [Setaria viridis]